MSEIVAGILILLSAFLSMAAGIGIVRFPDVLSRLHASTKPQILGVAAICVAIWLLTPMKATSRTVRARHISRGCSTGALFRTCSSIQNGRTALRIRPSRSRVRTTSCACPTIALLAAASPADACADCVSSRC